MSTDQTLSPIHYPGLLAEIRQRIQSAQARAMLEVNARLEFMPQAVALFASAMRLTRPTRKPSGQDIYNEAFIDNS